MVDSRNRVIEVEVVYALPERQTVLNLRVPAGSSLREAIAISGITARHPELDSNRVTAGVFGKRRPLSTVLREHDRIEIYRPLIADPLEVRRERARKPKARR